jgi:peptide/nickel transport system permease protein
MFKFLLRRIAHGLPVLLGVIVVIFFLFHALPGDPTRMLLGQRSDMSGIEAIKKDLGLDKPLATQFFNYLNDLSPLSFHNNADSSSFWFYNEDKYVSSIPLISMSDRTVVLKKPYLRKSYQSRRPVTEIIAQAFPATLILALSAMSFALFFGLIFGMLCAHYKDTWFDKITLLVSVGGMSVPSLGGLIIASFQ